MIKNKTMKNKTAQNKAEPFFSKRMKYFVALNLGFSALCGLLLFALTTSPAFAQAVTVDLGGGDGGTVTGRVIQTVALGQYNNLCCDAARIWNRDNDKTNTSPLADPHICRSLHRQRQQRALPHKPVQRPNWPVRRFRSTNTNWI